MKSKITIFASKVFIRLSQKGMFKWLNDKMFIKIMYRCRTQEKLNLDNPQTFNEKLQWLKLYDRKVIYTKMVDKYEAKRYVADAIGEEYIIQTIGVWDKVEDIDFDKLPNQFVLKVTHDSGGIIICDNKNDLDIEETKKILKKALSKNYYYIKREWPYKNIKPRIIAEKNMTNDEQSELIDYKFFCFNGSPKFIYVSEGLSDHKTAKMSFADMEYNKMEFCRKDYRPFDILPKKPMNFDKMKELARILSKDINFLRVDFYEIEGKIYFGELTFFPCSGFIPIEPKEYDKIIGDMLILPFQKREKIGEEQ